LVEGCLQRIGEDDTDEEVLFRDLVCGTVVTSVHPSSHLHAESGHVLLRILLLPEIHNGWRPDMVALRCTCEQGTNLWGEFWWIEGEHRWVFFDDEKKSETYAEQLTHCPECGRSLERKGLRVTTPSLLP
jgi:hypothetical protein